MYRKIIVIGMLIVMIIVLTALIRQIIDSLGAGGRVKQVTSNVQSLEAENIRLKQLLGAVSSTEYIEKVARDELNLGYAGETVVIISDQAKQQLLKTKPIEEVNLPNWQGWLKLFF